MDLTRLKLLASHEMAKYNLGDWAFAISNASRRLGVCKYLVKRIEISRYYATHSPEGRVLETLRHEIAHAIVGQGHGHGPVWKAAAIRLGVTPRACHNSPLAVTPPGDWQATCPTCNKTHHYYRRPRSLNGYKCLLCPAQSPIVWKFMGDPAKEPAVPLTPKGIYWTAVCPGCGTNHRKSRQPRGRWHCRCSGRNVLTWVGNHPAPLVTQA